MLKRILIAIALAIIVFIVVVYMFFGNHPTLSGANSTPPIAVTIAPAKSTTWRSQIKATGTVTSQSGIVLKAEVPGKITKLYISSGENVKAGAPLIQINPNTISAEYDEAQSQLVLMQTEFKRQQGMRDKNLGVAEQFDKAKAALDAAKAKLAALKAQLDQTLVTAPFSGRLGLLQVKLGDYVTPGQALVNLQNMAVLRVDFAVPEADISKLAVGQPISLQTKAFPKQLFNGKVFAIDTVIDPSTRMVNIRAVLDKPNPRFLPGLFGEVTLTVNETRNTISIPRTAVSYAITGDTVFRVVNGKAVATIVKLGEARGEQIEILSGLKAGEKIVTVGGLKLRDGAAVTNRK